MKIFIYQIIMVMHNIGKKDIKKQEDKDLIGYKILKLVL